MKNVILHFHIFKNAGTTIDWILEKNFGSKAAFIDDHSNPGATLSVNDVLDYLNENPDTKSISSHQIRFPVQNAYFHFIPIVFIRHPIDRALSIYSFKRRSMDNSLGTIKAKELTLSEYIRWNLDRKKFMPMKNFQVLYLSRTDTKSLVDIHDLEKAREHLKSCPIIGVVERLDESLIFAEEVLRPYFNNIDLSYIKQNVSADRAKKLEDRLEDARKQIGDKLMEELEARNKLDFGLHSYANEELDKRVKIIENLDAKLEEFRNRCSELASNQHKIRSLLC